MAFKLNRVSHPKNQILLQLYNLSQQNSEYSFKYARKECPGHVALYKEFGSVEVTVFNVTNHSPVAQYGNNYTECYLIVPGTIEEAISSVDDYIIQSVHDYLVSRVCLVISDTHEIDFQVDYHEFMEISDEAYKKCVVEKVHGS